MDFISENPESDHNIRFQSSSYGFVFLYNHYSQSTISHDDFKLSLSGPLLTYLPDFAGSFSILKRSHNLSWLGLLIIPLGLIRLIDQLFPFFDTWTLTLSRDWHLTTHRQVFGLAMLHYLKSHFLENPLTFSFHSLNPVDYRHATIKLVLPMHYTYRQPAHNYHHHLIHIVGLPLL